MSDIDNHMQVVTEEADLLRKRWNAVPPGWVLGEVRVDGAQWYNAKRRLSLIASIEIHNETQWVHVSLAHRRRIPTYHDIKYIRRHWIGLDRRTIMVFPTEEYHVNLHPNCLHLYACLDSEGDGLPEFSAPHSIFGRTI